MQVVLLIFLIFLGIGLAASGLLTALFPIGVGIYLLVTAKDADRAMDQFFALCFFSGIIVVAYEIIT